MGNKVFLNKKFSNYLGEQRALLDIVVRYEAAIPPSPSATPIPATPTPTPSVTPIPVTPSQTATPTSSPIPPTPSVSATQTSTPQPTGTPTNTPTPSSSPAVSEYLLFENGDIVETEQGDLLEPNL